jgi:hypothetical protein
MWALSGRSNIITQYTASRDFSRCARRVHVPRDAGIVLALITIDRALKPLRVDCLERNRNKCPSICGALPSGCVVRILKRHGNGAVVGSGLLWWWNWKHHRSADPLSSRHAHGYRGLRGQGCGQSRGVAATTTNVTSRACRAGPRIPFTILGPSVHEHRQSQEECS